MVVVIVVLVVALVGASREVRTIRGNLEFRCSRNNNLDAKTQKIFGS